MTGADLRTIVLRLLHAALAWFLPHVRALHTRLENLTRQASSTSDRDPRAELDQALRSIIDRAEARLAARVAAVVAFAQTLLTRLAAKTRDHVSRAESAFHDLTTDRAALREAAKAGRLAQARAEITGRAAKARARKLTTTRLATLRAALAAARRRDLTGFPAKAHAALALSIALATRAVQAARTRIDAAEQYAIARRQARQRASADRLAADSEAARAAVDAARLEAQQRGAADSMATPGDAAAADVARLHGGADRMATPGDTAAAAQAAVDAPPMRVEAVPADEAPVAKAQAVTAAGQAVAEWLAAEGKAAQAAVEAARRAAALRAESAAALRADSVVAEDEAEVGLAALLADIALEPVAPAQARVPGPRRARIPDGVRVVVAAAMVLAVIAGVGVWAGSLGDDAENTVKAQPSSAAPALPEPSPTVAEAAAPIEAAPKIVPLSQRNPITGPDRPPLPDDEFGPYGSRQTTGTYEVALTFDDGPDPRYTPEVLALLRQYHIKATFCVIGVNVVEFPHLVKAIAAEGHTLCNHSWVHDTGLGNRSFATIASDMARTNQAIRAAAPGSRVSYFRHPGGAWTQAAVDSARQQGMSSLHWDVDPRDWLRPGPRAISNLVTSSTQPGSIVLLHDGGGDRLGTVEALRSILPNLVSRLRLVALPPGIDPPRLHGIHLPIHAGQQ